MAIKFLDAKTLQREPASHDKTTVYTDGYINDFNSTTAPQDITAIKATGIITLSNIYVPGKKNLEVIVDGIELIHEGVDYTELSNNQIQLSAAIRLALNTATSNIRVRWNRPLPGARDQEFNNLKNCTPDLENAIIDSSTLRVSVANAANPLATIADVTASAGGKPEAITVFSQFAGDGTTGAGVLNAPGSLSLVGNQYTDLDVSAAILLTDSITYIGVSGTLALLSGGSLSATGQGLAGGAQRAAPTSAGHASNGNAGSGYYRVGLGNPTGSGGGGGRTENSLNQYRGGDGGWGGRSLARTGGAGGAEVTNLVSPAASPGVGPLSMPLWYDILSQLAPGAGGGSGGPGGTGGGIYLGGYGGAGGEGGGLIWIECNNLDFRAGSFLLALGAVGQAGQSVSSPNQSGPGGGGAGGTGGTIIVHTRNIIDSSGTIDVSGGTPGSGGTSWWGTNAAPGAAGVVGRSIIVLHT